MRIRLLAAATIGLLALAACSESSTAPTRLEPGTRTNDEITCRAGYVIATNSDGSQSCVPDAGTTSAPVAADTTSTPAAADTSSAPTTP